ncbi:hypothetical protein P7D22_08690 [Lichenihabitans sp. Uapishka_5]|uniref:hypothetical protein n=1 Tax=Lichenihabitans sp. Uapishka_5 TaxID=3037302 RepID=UPI0029E81E7B|nr:hypothetical protein [Lichenihabitans sp. Uapishka_5]MDX7951253.1 hypothetical protein [Lichenihabitans sp. Uapishka_5]
MGALMPLLTLGLPVTKVLGVAILTAAVVSVPASAAGRDVDAALSSMAKEIAEVRSSCNEPVSVSATPVALSDRVKGVHIVLTQPICLGQWGTYDYLLVRDLDGRWRSILGGPGPIRISRQTGSQFARIDVSAMMGCELRFTWDRTSYVRHGSPECAGGRKGTEWGTLERVMRASNQ